MISSIVNSLTPSHRPNDAVIGEIAAARSEHNERTLPEVPVRVTGEGEAATSVRETQSRRVPEPMTPAMTPAGPAQVPPHPQNATPRTVLHSVMQRSATIFLSPKYIVGAAIVHFILEAIAAVVVLSISWEEPCSDPLRPFIIVRVVLTGIRLQVSADATAFWHLLLYFLSFCSSVWSQSCKTTDPIHRLASHTHFHTRGVACFHTRGVAC